MVLAKSSLATTKPSGMDSMNRLVAWTATSHPQWNAKQLSGAEVVDKFVCGEEVRAIDR